MELIVSDDLLFAAAPDHQGRGDDRRAEKCSAAVGIDAVSSRYVAQLFALFVIGRGIL